MSSKDLTAEALKEVILLNPLKAFKAVPRKKERGNLCVLSRIPPEGLKLPEGWIYNAKDGIIMNKHHLKSDAYSKIDVIVRK